MRLLLVAALLAIGCVTGEDHADEIDSRGKTFPPIVFPDSGATGAGGDMGFGGASGADAGALVDADFSEVPTCAAWETPGRTIQVSLICPDQVHAICYAIASATDPGPRIGPCSLYDGQNRHLICTGSCALMFQ